MSLLWWLISFIKPSFVLGFFGSRLHRLEGGTRTVGRGGSSVRSWFHCRWRTGCRPEAMAMSELDVLPEEDDVSL
ncbi:hypothetical protein L2E82_13281 [Cichorium intybus]|uniref:Uncharacterized protein n=1 Tax=Cichorium intybus TaxID=13427 RepID=A0ACB9GJ23_CICIN|nr:hypothetical protein L2E82_13281 [Cichorium intybus]